MLSRVIFLLSFLLSAIPFSSCFVNLADVDCGIPKAPFLRIKDGEYASPGEFPWHVAILLRKPSKRTYYTCGGAVIHKRFVLTAAHCFESTQGYDILSVVGDYNRSATSGDEQEILASRVIIHENYTIDGLHVFNDIALLELEQDVAWTNFVRPVCLPDEDEDVEYHWSEDDDEDEDSIEPLVGWNVTVAGWGLSDEFKEGGELLDVLHKVTLPVVSLAECKDWYKQSLNLDYPLRRTHLCAGYREGVRDACLGDSGGPLLLKNEGRHVSIGLVSGGFGCGRPLQPGIYTRISQFMPWIVQNINFSGYYVPSDALY